MTEAPDSLKVYIDALRTLAGAVDTDAERRTVDRMITEARQHRRTVRAAERAQAETVAHDTAVTEAVQAAQAAATAAGYSAHDDDLTALLPA